MIIAADWVFPVTSEPLYRHAILVEKGRITEIRPAAEKDPVFKGCCILPGLINTHTHLAYTALRNLFDDLPFFQWIRKLTETKYKVFQDEDYRISTALGIWESLQSGMTTVADMSDSEEALKTLHTSPLRGLFYWEVFGVEKNEAERTWNDLPFRYDRLRKEYSSSRLGIGVSPHATYTVRPELYQKIGDWAFENRIPLSFHAAESCEEETFVSKKEGVIAEFLRERAADWTMLGSTSISHLAATGIFKCKPLLAHVVQASEEDLSLLAKYDVPVSHCPKSNAKFGHGVAPVSRMLTNGIRLGLGTDSAASNNTLDLFEEGRFTLLLQRSKGERTLTEQKILELLTIEGARALNMDQEIGSLQPGKMADLILVKIPEYYSGSNQVLHHLVHNARGTDVVKTFISGEEVVYPKPDPKSVYAKLTNR